MNRDEAEAIHDEILLIALDVGEAIRARRGVVLTPQERLAHVTGIHLGSGAAIQVLKSHGYLVTEPVE